MAGRLSGLLRSGASALYGAGWELRRRAYGRGWRRPQPLGARVVSVGNLTVGGTGKTTLTLHLAQRALENGLAAGVVCRRYRPGPDGRGDEELMYRSILGPARVFAGHNKLREARAAARQGLDPLFVDDGFSHWRLARDVDIVLLDANDLAGGGLLLPAGRLREPLRALQRAQALVVSRLKRDEDPGPWLARARAMAPGAVPGAGRHRVTAVRTLDGASLPPRSRVHIVTGTGNPEAVEATAREWGLQVASRSKWPDHHWFTPAEARSEQRRAREQDAWVLLTRKDEVRWPPVVGVERVAVLEVEWEWVAGGEAVERLALEGEEA